MHCSRPRNDERVETSNTPGCDIKAHLAGQSAARWCVKVLRKFAIAGIAGIAGGGSTAEVAPSPKAKALASTRGSSGARKGYLPVRFAISQGRARVSVAYQCYGKSTCQQYQRNTCQDESRLENAFHEHSPNLKYTTTTMPEKESPPQQIIQTEYMLNHLK